MTNVEIAGAAIMTLACALIACWQEEGEKMRHYEISLSWPQLLGWRLAVGTAVFAVALLGLWQHGAFAIDRGQYGDVPQPIRDWIKTLKTPLTPNSTCCDIADGNRDILWDTEGEGDGKRFRVRVNGQWLPVPPEAVINESNRIGYPIVWIGTDDRGQPRVKCFLPGAGG